MANDPVSEQFDDLCAKASNLEKEKRYEEAIQLWREAITLKSDDINPYLNIRSIYFYKYWDFRKSQDIMLQMINNVPDFDPMYYLFIGYIYRALKEYENGTKYYQKANENYLKNLSKIDKPLPANYFEVGISYHTLNDYENCINYYRKFYYSLSDNLVDEYNGYLNRTLFLSTAKKIDSLIRFISCDDNTYWDILSQYHYFLPEINSNSIEDKTIIYSITTLSKLHSKRYDRVIQTFESIESMEPKIWPNKIPDIIYTCVVSSYLSVKIFTEVDFQRFRELILKQLMSDPLNERIYLHFSLLPSYYFARIQRALFPEGKPPEDFKLIETATPEEFKTIEDTLLKRLEQSPDNVEILYILGVFYDIKKDYESAIKYLVQAIEINNNYPKAYKKLSELYGQCLKTEEGLKTGIKYGEKYLSLKNDEKFEKWDFRFIKERLEELKNKS